MVRILFGRNKPSPDYEEDEEIDYTPSKVEHAMQERAHKKKE